MSDDLEVAQKIAAYLAARKAFLDAEAAVDAIHQRLSSAAAAIQNAEMAVKNHHARKERSFNAANENAAIKAIPDAAEVLAVMVAWADARTAGRAAFDAIPDEHQSALAKPPKSMISV